MAYFLSIDASTIGCSVAIFFDAKLLSSYETNLERTAAEFLTTMIAKAAKDANLTLSQLSAVAVAKGPGSYTGLRIAVSTAKGLCFALGVPLISYGTLEGLVQQIDVNQHQFDILCPMLDARRLEVYCALYDAKTRNIAKDISAEILNENSFAHILEKNKVLFFGEGSEKCKTIFESPNAHYLNQVIYPSAKFSGELIYKKWQAKAFENLTLFEPLYLKEYMFKTKKP